MKIGILTGGGDVPGLNPCIKALVDRAIDAGHEAIGIRRGWAGLLYYHPDEPVDSPINQNLIMPLDKMAVRTVARTGGTFLHTSRTNPSNVKPEDVPEFLRGQQWETRQGGERVDLTAHVLKVIEALELDVVIAIGGDDTLSYAERLHREGVRVMGVPKTMDNDVFGTDYCIGFSTAVTRSVNFINNLRTSTGSHERIAVIELFGRNSGETSLIAAYLAGVDRAIISEVPFDVEKLAAYLMEDKRRNPSNYSMMTISEGARMEGGQIIQRGEADAYGHRKLGGIGLITGEAIKEITGENIIYQQLAYLMRSGAPDSLDLMVAFNYAHMTMDMILKGQSGRMVALRGGVYNAIPISMIMQGRKQVDVGELYDIHEYRPKIRHVAGMPMFLS
ncbi:MAG: phosphofructokinase [Chloroflexi bacterium]|nr:phosphofructokinase [Chloroflexota bacterium]